MGIAELLTLEFFSDESPLTKLLRQAGEKLAPNFISGGTALPHSCCRHAARSWLAHCAAKN